LRKTLYEQKLDRAKPRGMGQKPVKLGEKAGWGGNKKALANKRQIFSMFRDVS
jgi:hypothetical protein